MYFKNNSEMPMLSVIIILFLLKGFLSGHSDYFSHLTTNWERERMSGYDLMENDEPADIERYNGTYSTHLFGEKTEDIILSHGIEKVNV